MEVVSPQFSELNDDLSATITSYVEKVAKASNTGIDLMFAKFLQESGLPVSKIEMVQEQTPTGHKIYFRERLADKRNERDQAIR